VAIPQPTLREQAEDLVERLDRVHAGAVALRALAPELRHDAPPAAIVPLLDALARDLTLAASELDAVRERAARDVASLR
jgi:hypothetical protein